MKHNIVIKLAAAFMASAALAGCAACTGSGAEENSLLEQENAPADKDRENMEINLTLGQTADYFVRTAGKYGKTVDRSSILEGFEEGEKATRMQMLVLAQRAFGELPVRSGTSRLMNPPPVDVTDVPEWASLALQELSEGGMLADSDLEKAESPVTEADAAVLVSRFYALSGTNLKDDFYAAVNKERLDSMKIPEGEIFAGGSSTVTANTDRQLHELILEITASGAVYADGSPEQKIRDLYLSVLGTENRDREGIAPLRKYFDAVDRAEDYPELYAAIALAVNELGNAGNGLFPMVPVADTKNSSRYIMQLMTMPAYLSQEDYNDEESAALMEYRESIIKQLTAAGERPAEAERLADRMIQMERELSGQITDPEVLGNLRRETKRYTPELLNEMMPQAGPSELFRAIGLKPDVEMQVFDERQFEAYLGWFTKENLELFKAYQKMALLTGYSGYLSEDLAMEFGYGTTTGSEAANEAVQMFLSEELGELYVKRYFSSESRAEIEKMVNRLVDVFRDRIGRLEWMEESTKQEAFKKLDNITVLIGYPDEWQNTSAEIKSAAEGGSYFDNAAAMFAEQWRGMAGKMEEPVNPRRFQLAAYTVNAAASRNTNTIIFPAGILQPPFYDASASFEANLGSIGSTIAHEITHMFDDGGAQYDAEGTIRNWWSEEDYAHFQKLCGKVEAYYRGYEAVPGVRIDEKQTLSENIADIGGIACCLEVLSKMENPDYDAFFRSYAGQWARLGSYEDLAETAKIDYHAPNNLRCNRVLANFEEFADTYDMKPGDGMYVAPEDRIEIW